MGVDVVAIRSRASTTFSRSPALIRATASATTLIQCSPSSAPSAKLTSAGAAGRSVRTTGASAGSSHVDGGHPGGVAPAAHDHARHHEHRVAGLVGERERTEADHAAAGLADLVGHGRPAGGLAPPLDGVREAGGPLGADLGGDAPADQAVVATQPGDGPIGRQQLDQLPWPGRDRGRDVRTTRPSADADVGTSVVELLVTRSQRTRLTRTPGSGPGPAPTTSASSRRAHDQ